MKIRIDQSDKTFSQYVRLKDGRCMRCGSKVEVNEKGLPISHTCAHFHGRAHEGTRFESDNCDCLCFGCHEYFGANPSEYVDWKKKRLGLQRFKTLDAQAHTYHKKDRKLELIKAKFLLEELT